MTKVVSVTWTFNVKQVTNIALLQWRAQGTMIKHPLGPPPYGCHALGMAPRPMTLAWTLVMAGRGSRRWFHVRDQVWGDNLGSGNVAIRCLCINLEHHILTRMGEEYVCELNLSMIEVGAASRTQLQKEKMGTHIGRPSLEIGVGGGKVVNRLQATPVPYVSFSKSPYDEP